MPPIVVEQVSQLSLSAPVVWDRVTTPAGIRDELRPVLSMTMPPGLRGRSVAEADKLLDQPLGKAWLLLFGVLPVEYDDMRIVSLENGRSFHERSRMLLCSDTDTADSPPGRPVSSNTVHRRVAQLVTRSIRAIRTGFSGNP